MRFIVSRIKYSMNDQQFTQYVLKRLNEAGRSYTSHRARHLYEQGVLIGLLSSLAQHDSKNFDIIKRQFDKLTK